MPKNRPDAVSSALSWPQAGVDANPYAFLAHLGNADGIRFRDEGHVAWLESELPVPLFNSIFALRFGDTPELVRGLSRHRGAPGLWWLGPSARPRTAGQLLEREGLRKVASLPLMTVDLAQLLPESAAAGDAVRTVPVRDAGYLRAWVRAHAVGNSQPVQVEAAWWSVMDSLGTDETSPLQHYVLAVDGVPAASASIFLHEQTAGLYNVAVAPDRRGRGLGTAISRAALVAARDRGYRDVVLGAEGGAEAMYTRIGFVETSVMTVYSLAPD